MAEEICQVSIDTEEYLVVLLRALQQLCDTGLQGVSKTLLISSLLQTNEKYVETFGKAYLTMDNHIGLWCICKWNKSVTTWMA